MLFLLKKTQKKCGAQMSTVDISKANIESLVPGGWNEMLRDAMKALAGDLKIAASGYDFNDPAFTGIKLPKRKRKQKKPKKSKGQKRRKKKVKKDDF